MPTRDGVYDGVDHYLQSVEGTDALEAAESTQYSEDPQHSRSTEECQTYGHTHTRTRTHAHTHTHTGERSTHSLGKLDF